MKWLRPSEVTEPGSYWYADGRGLGRNPTEIQVEFVVNITLNNKGELWTFGPVYPRPLSMWDSAFRLLGPIEKPKCILRKK